MDPITGNFEVVSNFYGVSQQFIDVNGNEKCVDDLASQYAIISGVLSGLLLVLFIVFIIVYRHYKLEAELASMTWKIRFDDIITSSGIHNRTGFGSRISLARVSL
jgi:atrial natriuretic peptide receptor A